MDILMKRIAQMLNKKTLKQFEEFMKGQTVVGNMKGETMVFEDDFLRFVHELPVID